MIAPKCLRGYLIDPRGAGRFVRSPEGERYNVPEPIIGYCMESEGLCWWLRPVGWYYSITLPVSKIKRFFS